MARFKADKKITKALSAFTNAAAALKQASQELREEQQALTLLNARRDEQVARILEQQQVTRGEAQQCAEDALKALRTADKITDLIEG